MIINFEDGLNFETVHYQSVSPARQITVWADGWITHPITGERLCGRLLFTANPYCAPPNAPTEFPSNAEG